MDGTDYSTQLDNDFDCGLSGHSGGSHRRPGLRGSDRRKGSEGNRRERVRDYAELAAEQYASSVSMALDYEWFYPVFRVLSVDADGLHAPGAHEMIEAQTGRQRLGDLAAGLFLVELKSGAIVQPNNWPSAALDQRLEDAAQHHALVASDRGWPVTMGVVGGSQAQVFLVLRTLGEPSAISGFTAPLSALGHVLGATLRADRVLPSSLTDKVPAEELVAIRISTPDGNLLFETGPAFDPTFAATTTLGPRLADLRLEAAIPPDAAPRLVIGGLPRSRLPTVVAMLTIAVGLLGASVLLSRRERELVRMREHFVAGASHELRTPLAQIRMFAETLRLDRVRSSEERQRSVEILDREARRLSYLVENLLQFSRTGNGQQSTAMERVDLRSLSMEVIEGFRPLAAARGASVALEAPSPVICARRSGHGAPGPAEPAGQRHEVRALGPARDRLCPRGRRLERFSDSRRRGPGCGGLAPTARLGSVLARP